MPKFKVTKVYQYTETVYVEADCYLDAMEAGTEVEGQYNNDDNLYDFIVEEIEE